MKIRTKTVLCLCADLLYTNIDKNVIIIMYHYIKYEYMR